MPETYTVVGSQMGLSMLLGLLTVALILVFRGGTKALKPVYKSFGGIMVCICLAVLFDLPMEWFLGTTFIGLGGYMAFNKRFTNRYVRFGASVYLVIVGVVSFCMWTLFPNHLTLNSQAVNFTENERVGTVARTGLAIDQSIPSSFLGSKPSSSWTSFSGDNLGPDINGSFIYWGPNGLIRRDDVARRLATWAGVEPTMRDFHLPSAK
ncbi:hypothetical protein BH11ARM1_BH11ARM1_07580 [soil metagenome]